MITALGARTDRVFGQQMFVVTGVDLTSQPKMRATILEIEKRPNFARWQGLLMGTSCLADAEALAYSPKTFVYYTPEENAVVVRLSKTGRILHETFVDLTKDAGSTQTPQNK